MRLLRKLPASLRVRLFFLFSFAVCVGVPSSDTHADATPFYSVDFHTISSGGNSLVNSCYRLSGTVGQAAPGYSAGSIYALIAGYWQAPSVADADTIFFNGFEEC
jgi:hypothetical protein